MRPREMLGHLLERRHLDEEEAGESIRLLVAEATPAPMVAALLVALQAKGIRFRELRGCVAAMRVLASCSELPPHGPLIDIVGTGRDALVCLNYSTGAALLVAAMGGQVVKHGTTSVSSRSGS